MANATDEHDAPINDEGITWETITTNNLRRGDHICWMTTGIKYWRHAIVCDSSGETVTLIGWKFKSDNRQNSLNPEIVQSDKCLSGKTIHRACYMKEHPPDKVVCRAQSQLGDKDYHAITNYARAFPRWCKTGYGGVTYVPPNKRAPIWSNVKVSECESGDHICWRSGIYIRHAIITEPWKKGNVRVIGWSFYPEGFTIFPRPKIIEQKVIFGIDDKVWKANYNHGACYVSQQVVQRARSRVSETAYGLLTNYARAFPRWCVTGHGGINYQDEQ